MLPCGCKVDAGPSVRPVRQIETGQTFVDPGDGTTIIIDGASTHTIRGRFERCPAEIFRSFRDLGWGLIRTEFVDGERNVTRYQTAQPVDFKSDNIRHVKSRGIVPDGRVIRVHCLATDGSAGDAKKFIIAVRVGNFGDGEIEQQFISMFAAMMKEKPYPIRDRAFELP